MTCIEKWREISSAACWTNKEIIENECPSSYGITADPPYASGLGCSMSCEECWHREVPEGPDYDRDTALAILKEFSRDMRPSLDIFGNKILTIRRDKFEAIRKKYLDGKGEQQ